MKKARRKSSLQLKKTYKGKKAGHKKKPIVGGKSGAKNLRLKKKSTPKKLTKNRSGKSAKKKKGGKRKGK